MKPQPLSPNPLAAMFNRKKAGDDPSENACPYCEHVNEVGAEVCGLCYYELSKTSREQGEAVDQKEAGDIFDELMSDEDDAWKESSALDVELSMEEISVDVDQYEIVELEEDETESIEIMSSKIDPGRSETKEHEEIVIEEDLLLDDTIKDFERFEIGEHDHMAEVSEPVHMGKGNLVIQDINSDNAPEVKSASELPELPDEDELNLEAVSDPASNNTNQIEEDNLVEVSTPVGPPQESTENKIENTARIWPWPEDSVWDPRDVHREVVSALESAKSGQTNQAAEALDRVGPHLGENLELLYHIGMIMKQIGREEQMREMLALAQQTKPGDPNVVTATTHLLE